MCKRAAVVYLNMEWQGKLIQLDLRYMLGGRGDPTTYKPKPRKAVVGIDSAIDQSPGIFVDGGEVTVASQTSRRFLGLEQKYSVKPRDYPYLERFFIFSLASCLSLLPFLIALMKSVVGSEP
jgi:hypothetical protein